MKIEVTAEDIAKGKRRDPFACVVGLAVARALHVDLTDYLHKEETSPLKFAVFGINMRIGWHHFSLSPDVKDFITAWEDGEKVVPFTFEILDSDVFQGGFANVLS